jgi:acetyltransferase-like isoleucine patch superfamily enzyme
LSLPKNLLSRLKPAIVAAIQTLQRAAAKILWLRARATLGHIGIGSRLTKTVKIYAGRTVHIGNRTVLNDFVHIWGAGGVTIGDDCLVAAHVVITSQSHDVSAARRGALYSQTTANQPVVIGDNVWIGSNATVLPGVTIGAGAVIGAGSVVTRDVKAYHLALGVPARTIRTLL